MGDGEVRGENGHGIAENQVFVSVEDSFLAFREVIRAEETSSPVSFCSANLCCTAPDSSGIVLETDRKPPAGEASLPDVLKRFIAFQKIRPHLFLLRQKIEAKSRKTIGTFFFVKDGINP